MFQLDKVYLITTYFSKNRLCFYLKTSKVVYRVALCVYDITRISNINSGETFFIARFILIANDFRTPVIHISKEIQY